MRLALTPPKLSGNALPSDFPGATLTESNSSTDLTPTSPSSTASISAQVHIFETDYKLEEKLRSGSYGTVYTTRHRKSNEEFAVKVIDRTKLKEKDDLATFREIGIMKDLADVNNIVKLIDVYIVPETFYIVQVYARGGDVFDRLAKRVSYTEKDARDLGVILLEIMRDMHKRKVAHRDMKPENLLLKSSMNDTSILLADFGFAKYVPEEGLKTRCGTPAFVAPEILVGKQYNTQVDMWSVGCLIYMLIGGYPPFQDETHRGLFRKIRAADFTFHDVYWKNVSLSAKQLITNMLTVDPADRLNAQKCLESDWLEVKEENLSVRDLSGSIAEAKKFNARRKLKSAVSAVMWSVGKKFKVEKMSELMQQTDKVAEKETCPSDPSVDGPHKLNMSLVKRKKFAEVYDLGQKIHRGSAGVVMKCISKDLSTSFAVKIIKRSPKTDEAVLQEVSIMNQLDHPNLVKVVDFFEEEDNYYIVMELMAGGDVFDRILDMNNYTEKDARDLFIVLLESIEYMHEKGIAHRDIKPQNIFLDSKDSHSRIKIGDFGFAKKVHTPKSLTSRCGTPSYVAPEILKNQPYDQSCDMWSAGVVLYVMLCGYTPFSDESQEKMFERIKLGDWKFDPDDWSHISDEAKDLIKHLMDTNVDHRFTASQALKSRWITGLSDKQLSIRNLSNTAQAIKDHRPRLKDIGHIFTAMKITGNKVLGDLSTVASSTLESNKRGNGFGVSSRGNSKQATSREGSATS
ncbi:protein kinase [Nitzschia inconspicua]|uniref:non-specific serine/threonine protein kinase n=1 Tax=Nitzschia inconspicua TaxID=303405 RepID=A0A9K3Q4X6_9STRA|nr:protein kinase [Nitzschia inconspicua]